MSIDPPDPLAPSPHAPPGLTGDWIDAFTEQALRTSLRGMAAFVLAAVLPAVFAYITATIVAPGNTSTQLNALLIAFSLSVIPIGLICHLVSTAARSNVQCRAARRCLGARICLHCGCDKSSAQADPCPRCGRPEAIYRGPAGPLTCDYLGSIPEIASLRGEVHVMRVLTTAHVEMGPIASPRIMTMILLLVVAPVLTLIPSTLLSSNRLAVRLGFDPTPSAALLGFTLALAMPLLYRQWLVRQFRHDVRREVERNGQA